MTRLILIASMTALIAVPAAAKSKKDRICEAFGDASQQMAEMRVAGKSETEAQLAFLENNSKSELLALQLVPVISSFVYALPDDQLAGDVETPSTEQCKAHFG